MKVCLIYNTLYENLSDIFIIFHNPHRFLCLEIVHKNALSFSQVALRSLFFILSPYYKLNTSLKQERSLWQEVLETLLETNAHTLHVPAHVPHAGYVCDRDRSQPGHHYSTDAPQTQVRWACTLR